jgi:hypothetical protein
LLLTLCCAAQAQKRRVKRSRVARPMDARTALVLRVAAARQIPPSIKPAGRAALRKVVALLRKGNRAAAKAEFKRFARGHVTRATKKDVMAIIQWVLREAYAEKLRPLRQHADKVRTMNEAKHAVRRQIQTLSRLKAGAAKTRRWRALRLKRTGKLAVASPGPWKTGTKADLEAAIKGWEQQLQTIGDDSQLLQLDLQNTTQKMQQTVTMISNISKALHDTAMAVIRNIK